MTVLRFSQRIQFRLAMCKYSWLLLECCNSNCVSLYVHINMHSVVEYISFKVILLRQKSFESLYLFFNEEKEFRSTLLRICKKIRFVPWLSVSHGTSNFVYPKTILYHRSHDSTYHASIIEIIISSWMKWVAWSQPVISNCISSTQ